MIQRGFKFKELIYTLVHSYLSKIAKVFGYSGSPYIDDLGSSTVLGSQ